MAASGDLKNVRAFILADIVGGKTPHFRRDPSSTKWLVELIWSTAGKLGYSNVFVNIPGGPGGDDHDSFLVRNVPSVDIIDLDTANDVPYWHTTEDTLDKIDAKTLAIVGHTILESIQEIQAKK
jgi:Zn-dependent M28 family amino/carboxypeptidase